MRFGINATVTDKAVSEIGKAGFDSVYGARPLKRAIQSEIENALSNEILSGRIDAKDHLEIDCSEGKFIFNIKS